MATGSNVFGVSYTYDSLNRLTNVDYGNGSVISYTYDAAGNRLTYSGAVANDTIPPSISITNPTSGWGFTNTSATINLSGTASDNVGVTLVTWQNLSGGVGVANGTNSWTITGIPLKTGENDIFVTAYDAAGNSDYATLVVTLATGIGPTPPNQITGYSLANGVYRFTLSGPVGSNYVIYASSDLKYWTPLWTNSIPSAGLMAFVDPSAGGYAKRFYRAVPPGTAVTLLPPPPTSQLTGIRVTAGGMFEFNLNGPVGSNYVIQVSSNLVNWSAISLSTILVGGSVTITDPGMSNQPRRFYRAVQVPASMAWIPPGTFMMGSPTSEALRVSDETQHTVTLTKGFYMGKYAVTQGEYLALMGSNPSYFTTNDANLNPISPDLSRPVETVSWDDATNYCAHLTQQEQAVGRLPAGWVYRLPTESEREYACRAATTTAFHYGNALHGGMANFYDYYEYDASIGDIYFSSPAVPYLARTTTVGSYQPNGWGLYDMHGNVWEWCRDWYDSYPTGSVIDPQGATSGSNRVVRGGCWGNFGRLCRSASRSSIYPTYWGISFGFRVVLAPGQP